MTAKLAVICHKQSNDSYFAMCPELDGCYTQGDTYEEAMENLRELVLLTIKEETDDTFKLGIFSKKATIYSDMIVEI